MPDLAGVTLMAVFAHPDDEALACGGTLARAADAGARVVLVSASRGELGSVSDPALVQGKDLGNVRAAEMEASAAVLGARQVHVLDHPDGSLRWADALDVDLAALLARHRPAAVITFDADGLYWHGDHIGVHERVSAAVLVLADAAPALYYATLAHGAIRALVDATHARGAVGAEAGLWGISPDAFGVATPTPTFRVDVRAQVGRKLAALRCHRTQFGPASLFVLVDDDHARLRLGFELFRRAPGGSAPDVLEALGEPLEAA